MTERGTDPGSGKGTEICAIAAARDEGGRLDVFAAAAAGISRARAQELIERGAASVNGAAKDKNYRLRGGDRLCLTLPPPAEDAARPQDIPVELVYEDAQLIVVNKPQGMVVHPAPGNPDGTLVNALLFRLQGRLSTINGRLRPGIVHRIDKDTAGLLIAAKTDAAHSALAAQIAAHSFERRYEAVVCGNVKNDAGTVDAPIARHRTDRKRMAVRRDGKAAMTHYEVLARYKGFTHLRLRLETGRTHQIRVHMAHIGHPVAGDAVYGGRALPGLRGQCLLAKHIGFTHPETGEWLEFEAGYPDFFSETLEYLKRLDAKL